MNPCRFPLAASTLRNLFPPRGFTLVEMLVVLAVISVLIGLITPALGPLKGSQDVTTAAYNVAGALETARNYAMANNTYTWIGFYEQDYASTSAPTSATPPASPGVGHLTVGIVYSKDGSKVVDDTIGATTFLTADGLGVVDKLLQIYNVHLTKLDKPTTPNATTPPYVDTLQGRPYPEGDDASVGSSFISSESVDSLRPFKALGYTFSKTIRFNPRGEANVNSTLPCTKIVELGLQPTHGGVKNDNAPNKVAIQQTGIGGAVNIYRP